MTTKTISLLVQGSPFSSHACVHALDFAKATIRKGHQLFRIFFYKDGVLIANCPYHLPFDERDMQQEWIDFATECNLKLFICVAACERRGLQIPRASEVNYPFQFAGLGQLTEAMVESDRLVTFL